MCHSFLICPSVEGRLGCFPVLAIVNSAVLNTGVGVSFPVTLSSGSAPTSDSASPTAFSQGDYPLVFACGFGRGWSVPLTWSWQNSQTSGWFLKQSVPGLLQKLLGKKLFTGTTTRVRPAHTQGCGEDSPGTVSPKPTLGAWRCGRKGDPPSRARSWALV